MARDPLGTNRQAADCMLNTVYMSAAGSRPTGWKDPVAPRAGFFFARKLSAGKERRSKAQYQMLFNPLQLLHRLRSPLALSPPFAVPPLPLLLAVQTMRCISRARRDRPYRRSRPTGGQAAVDGTWKLVLTTPLGKRNTKLSLKVAGGKLSGRQSADGNSARIFDGEVNGDDVAWKVSITTPMPLTLKFRGTVAGNNISGEVDVGSMGNFPFRGERV
jgi:hypothetical protein